MPSDSSAVAIQRDYYAQTASNYDEMHLGHDEEHDIALQFFAAMIHHYKFTSVLDVGAGTGRTISFLNAACPGVKVVGIEPVKALREIGHSKGLSPEVLIDGDGSKLGFADGAFDVVTEFAVLHHVPKPAVVVDEMLRVARRGIFISDANNYGQGGSGSRRIKQTLRALRLWKLFNLVKTKGKGYSISEGDGLYYSYSVFDNYAQIRRACGRVHVLNTRGTGVNPYRTAGQVALLGLKDKSS
jgi:ubiquinone/menaquinone biosynthesis C-methylase UbiE